MKVQKVSTAAEHRALLLQSMEALAENRMNVSQANAMVGLSGEVHKSIRQEFDMRCYAAEHLTLEQGRIVKMLVAPEELG